MLFLTSSDPPPPSTAACHVLHLTRKRLLKIHRSRRESALLPIVHAADIMEEQSAKCRSFSPPSAGGATASTPCSPARASARLSLLDVSLLVASGGWLDLRSGKQLQEASATLCRDCREYVGSHLRVDYSTPRALWPLRMAGIMLGGVGRTLGRGGSGRSGQNRASIPPLLVKGITWERPLGDLAHGRALPVGLEDLYFVCSFRYFDVDWVSFPSSLLSLSFGENFDQSIDTVAWPPCLQRLTFGWEFNQSIDGVQWPSGLKKLTFGQSFDQPIESVSWPLGLEDLTFGGRFHQPIHNASFPPGLRRLTFGWRFNHSIASVAWPPALHRLMFGSLFNQVSALFFPAWDDTVYAPHHESG